MESFFIIRFSFYQSETNFAKDNFIIMRVKQVEDLQ